jgi:hypothetical protein
MVPVSRVEAPAEGHLALDIDNHRGSVTVIVNPKLAEPVVTATTRDGRFNAPTQWTAATMATDAGRPVLRVLSAAPDETAAPLVDLTVRVPDCAGVRVRADEGMITLRGVRGAIDAQTSISTPGLNAIFITTEQALKEPILLHTDRGSIEVRMGTGSAGHLRADAPAGTVSVDAAMGDLRDVQYTRQVWKGWLNKGSADMRLTAENGNIIVKVGR